MTDKITLLVLCILVALFFSFLILCYKRVFLEKLFSVFYFLMWFIVTILQVVNSSFDAKTYLVFSLFVTIAMVSTITIGCFLKKYLKSLFSSLIELSFDQKCTLPILIFRDAIATYISKGYIIYIYNTEKMFIYRSIDEITLIRHRQIVSRLDQIERKKMD